MLVNSRPDNGDAACARRPRRAAFLRWVLAAYRTFLDKTGKPTKHLKSQGQSLAIVYCCEKGGGHVHELRNCWGSLHLDWRVGFIRTGPARLDGGCVSGGIGAGRVVPTVIMPCGCQQPGWATTVGCLIVAIACVCGRCARLWKSRGGRSRPNGKEIQMTEG